MKKYANRISIVLIVAIVVALFATFVPVDGVVSATSNAERKIYSTYTMEDDFDDDTLIVVINNKESTKGRTYTTKDFANINCKEVEDLFVKSENNERFNKETYHKILKLKIANPGKQNMLNAIKILEQRDDVICVAPDRFMPVEETKVESSPTTRSSSSAWWLDTIDYELASRITHGSSGVLVGVIDSGIDCDHPALVDNVRADLAEKFVDDIYARDEDPIGHGTFIAGIIGGKPEGNNNVQGICNNVGIVPLRVYTFDGLSVTGMCEALAYAESKGIRIVNMSLELDSSLITPSEIGVLNNTINDYDGIVICCAGNGGDDYIGDNIDVAGNEVYPAFYTSPNIITVGASTEQDVKRGSSNFGRNNVDIFAPGDNIYSTGYNGGYDTDSGTSFATPMVTAVAALLLSRCPTMTDDELITALLQTGDIVLDANGESVFEDLCVSGRRLNAYQALLSHPYTYTCIGAESHRMTCTTCGYSEIESHDIRLGNMKLYCTKCDYESDLGGFGPPGAILPYKKNNEGECC